MDELERYLPIEVDSAKRLLKDVICGDWPKERMSIRTLEIALWALENINRADGWVSVEERLPENGVYVAIIQDTGWVGKAQIEEDGWHWYDEEYNKLGDPIYWMPLPPKKGE